MISRSNRLALDKLEQLKHYLSETQSVLQNVREAWKVSVLSRGAHRSSPLESES